MKIAGIDDFLNLVKKSLKRCIYSNLKPDVLKISSPVINKRNVPGGREDSTFLMVSNQGTMLL